MEWWLPGTAFEERAVLEIIYERILYEILGRMVLKNAVCFIFTRLINPFTFILVLFLTGNK